MSQAAVAFPAQMTEREITVTDSAGEKFAQLLAEADQELTAVRVFVSGGGCGGMQYGLTFAEGPSDTDSVLSGEGYTLVVDPVALNYIEGCEIDFREHGMQSTFVFNNVFKAIGGSGACGGCGGGACGA